jgi:hypothetical protein
MANPSESVRAAAVAAYYDRLRTAPPPVDNAAFPAGADMIFYCRACRHVCDIKPESYYFPPNRYCSECRGLIDQGWIPRPLV